MTPDYHTSVGIQGKGIKPGKGTLRRTGPSIEASLEPGPGSTEGKGISLDRLAERVARFCSSLVTSWQILARGKLEYDSQQEVLDSTVQEAVLDSFGKMLGCYLRGVGNVGNSAS